jgi:biopolymer transport protein ExbD
MSSFLRLSARGTAALLSLGLSALLSACILPTPATHAVLKVAPDGTLALDTRAVSPTELPAVLASRHAQAPGLMVEIEASPRADIAQVKAAILTVRQAHVRLAFDKAPGPV